MRLYKKSTYLAGAALVASIGLASCDKFGNTDVNPNQTTTPVTSALITSVESMLGADAMGNVNASNAAPLTGYYNPYFVQHYSQIQYPDNQLYQTTGVSWDSYYAGPLMDLQNVIVTNTAKPDPNGKTGNTVNQIQIARILKAYYFSIVTDKYGDVPYSQALKGNISPAYDKQQDIYKDLFKELKEASAAFQSTGSAIGGDIIYAGNLANWKRFANSLRLALALRLSKVDPATGKTEFMAALADANGIIDDNKYNLKVAYPGGTFNNPLYNLTTASLFAIAKPLADLMNSYTDPRVVKYGQLNGSGVVKGFPYGLNRTNAQAWIVANPDYSLAYDKTLKVNNAPIHVFTAAYVDLLRAEAAITYATGEDPAALLKKGISDSWAQWGVTGDVNAYLTTIGVTGVPAVAKIQEQLWIALFGSEQNAFSEWRRTGIPVLTPAPDATNPSKKIPRRFPYPSTEININTAAYNAAVSAMPYSSKDDVDGRVWWDKP